MQAKVLFIDTAHPLLQDMLEQMGYACDYFPDALLSDYISLAPNYVGFVIRSKILLDETILRQATSLRFIARVGAGMENIDTIYAAQRGIVCLNAPEGNRDAVAEHALGMLLALFNRLLIADSEVRTGVWKREANRGIELGGKTVAIIGYGNTGSSFARKLSGFDVKVIAYDKYKSGFSNAFVTEVDMNTIFAETDVLSLHVPLTAETHCLVNTSFLNRFVKPIFLINTARGKVVNTTDLITALESGKVPGACLDVLEYEQNSFESLHTNQIPESFQKLKSMDQVILSPHIAGWTHESNLKMAKVLAEKIKGLDKG